MTARSLPMRRQALVEITRKPPPAGYDYQPHNRKQRRHLERQLRKAAKRGAQR